MRAGLLAAFSAAVQACPAALEIPSAHRASLLQCASVEEFEARFWNAPNWVLERIQSAMHAVGCITAELPNGSHAWLWPDGWVSSLRATQAADKAARQFSAAHPLEALRLSFAALRKAFLRGEVVIEDAPRTTNWDFCDDHPGEYTDSAWTSSKEIADGVWSEAKHGVGRGTRRWTVIRPVLALALIGKEAA